MNLLHALFGLTNVGNELHSLIGHRLVELLKQFYLGERRLYDVVVAFNENGELFDFNLILEVSKRS